MPPGKSIKLTDRDVEIFHTVYVCRFLLTRQIAAHFFTHLQAAQRRLKQLSDAGYLASDQEDRTHEAIWRITMAGVTYLQETGRIPQGKTNWSWKHSQAGINFKEHEAQANGLYLAIRAATMHQPDISIRSWRMGRVLHDSVVDHYSIRYPVRPDRFLQIVKGHSLYNFLIEVDRGTKPEVAKTKSNDVSRQLYAYSAYSRGGFARKYAGPNARPRDFPFRLLVTSCNREGKPSLSRMFNMIAAVIQKMATHKLPPSPIRGYALFAEAVKNPLAPIWLREIEVAGVLKLLEKLKPNQPLGALLSANLYSDVRQKVPAQMLQRAYRMDTFEGIAIDTDVRDAFLGALLATGRIKRFGMLEPSWK